MKKIARLVVLALVVSFGVTVGGVATAPPASAGCGYLSRVNSGVFKNWYAFTNCTGTTANYIVQGGGYDGPLQLRARQTYYFETYVYIYADGGIKD